MDTEPRRTEPTTPDLDAPAIDLDAPVVELGAAPTEVGAAPADLAAAPADLAAAPADLEDAEPIVTPPAAPRDGAYWATGSGVLDAPEGAAGVLASSVSGRRLAGPVQGFGKMWQKTYKVRIGAELTPEQVIDHWRANYGEFWPTTNRFIAPLAGITPGEVGLIQGRVGGLTLSTGVLVLYSDDVSFAFLTPEGHPFAGLITFSAHREGEETVAQVQLLIRAQDALTEVGMAFGGHRKEDAMWQHTLRSLAASFGVDTVAETEVVCVDRRRQWRRFGNVRHDPALRALRHPRGGR